MGMFQVKVKVSNPQDVSRSFEDMFWVDTEALYSNVPEDQLKSSGIAPRTSREFVLADGRRDRRLIGIAEFGIDVLNESVPCTVVYGPPSSLYLLGATAMENFCVEADPATQTLKPITAAIGTMLTGR